MGVESSDVGRSAPGVAGTTVRDCVMDFLRARGMTTIFGNPGSTELPMLRNFPADFRYVLGLQESVVVAMADGYAQATRKPAFVNLHSAAGVGHGLGNIFTAFKNQTPLIVTAGQQARSILPYEPFLFAQQAVDFPQPYVKWSNEPARAQDVPAALARAWYEAMQPPCGPVFVSIPVDDWDRPCEPVALRRVSTAYRGDAAMLEEIAGALNRAERPALVVGPSVAREDAWDEVISLAEMHQARVWASPMSPRNGFPEHHALFAGFMAARREGIVQTLSGCDVVVVLGAPAFLYHTEGSGPHAPEGTTIFQLIDDPAMAACATAAVSVVTSLKSGIQELLAGSKAKRRVAPAALARPPRVPATSLTEAYLFQQIAALRPARSVIVEEAPSSRTAMRKYLPIVQRDGFYTGASGGLGFALPAAIGVALGRPNDKVIAILGDGSSMYAIQALWTAAQLGLGITFVIIRNGGYAALVNFGRHFGLEKSIGTDLPGLDFVGLARSQGIAASKVDRCADLDEQLTAALASAGPVLLEVVVE